MKKTFTATVSVTNYYTVRNKSCLHPWKPVWMWKAGNNARGEVISMRQRNRGLCRRWSKSTKAFQRAHELSVMHFDLLVRSPRNSSLHFWKKFLRILQRWLVSGLGIAQGAVTRLSGSIGHPQSATRRTHRRRRRWRSAGFIWAGRRRRRHWLRVRRHSEKIPKDYFTSIIWAYRATRSAVWTTPEARQAKKQSWRAHKSSDINANMLRELEQYLGYICKHLEHNL